MIVEGANNMNRSNLKNILWLFYKPRLFFSQIDGFDKVALIMPAIAATLMALSQKNIAFAIFMFISIVVTTFILTTFFILVFRIGKDTIRMSSLYSALLYLNIISIFFIIAKLIFPGFIRTDVNGNEYSILSIAFLFEKLQTTVPFLFGILTILDVSAFCGVAMNIIAVSTMGNISIKKSLIYCLIVFLPLTIVMGLINLAR